MNTKEKSLKNLVLGDCFDGDMLFEQYRLYVEMANDVSNRRDKTNKLYITVISLFVTVFSIIISLTNELFVLFILLVAIILVCFVWEKNIESYSVLNRVKFDVINEIEKKLPAKGFTIEGELLGLYQYDELTNLEKKVPIVLKTISIIAIVLLVLIKIGCKTI